MDEATLRTYRAGDWKAMYALDVVCFAPPFRFTGRAMRQFAEARGAITVLAEADEGLAGFCVAQIEGAVGYVVTLDVAAAWRRRGLARRLMDAVEEKGRGAGAERIELHVFSGNADAVRLYEALGYMRISIVESFYGPGFDALVYGRQISQQPGSALRQDRPGAKW